MSVRVIPRLDIKGPHLVKGIHLEGLRVLGTPQPFARYYYEHGADELLYLDAVASLYGRNSLLELIRETARAIFIPLTVGGGLRTIDDIRDALRSGADKVSLNTAAVNAPELVREASRKFGSSTIVVSIDVIRQPDGRYEVFTESGREQTGLEAKAWAQQVAGLGAGEILITSVDREGTGRGFDLELVRMIADGVDVPVVAGGGAGSVDDIGAAITQGHADAVSLASILHYHCIDRPEHLPPTESNEGNTEYLRRRVGRPSLTTASIPEIKQHLGRLGVPCRPSDAAVAHG